MEKRKLSHDSQEEPAKRRVIGPSLPPPGPESAATETPTADAASDTAKAEGNSSNSDSDSDSDDDFGPSLPPPHGQSAPAPEPTYTTPSAPEQKPESQRDQWMLHPPEQSDWASKIDPTQLRNRKFQTGKSARSGGASKNLDAAWVETPEEKLRRLEDAVMGVGAPSSGGSGGGSAQSSGKANAEKDRAMEEKIKKYNDRSGKNTRLEKAEKKKKEEEDDPSTRAFDREKDMAVSSKISNAQRREMVNKASDYGSRFSKGNYL